MGMVDGGGDSLDNPRDIFVFPEAQHSPPGRLKRSGRFRITSTVGPDLVWPVVGVVLEGRAAMVGTPVPEAAIDEDSDPLPGEDDVCPSTKGSLWPCGDSIAEPQSVE
jgi:hypothetical protein